MTGGSFVYDRRPQKALAKPTQQVGPRNFLLLRPRRQAYCGYVQGSYNVNSEYVILDVKEALCCDGKPLLWQLWRWCW